MILLTLFSCLVHKTSLVGVVDYTDRDSCAVELNGGTMIVISSSVCENAKEGDTIQFYTRKK